jgi:DNA-binding CsgD family transcriptional regulator
MVNDRILDSRSALEPQRPVGWPDGSSALPRPSGWIEPRLPAWRKLWRGRWPSSRSAWRRKRCGHACSLDRIGTRGRELGLLERALDATRAGSRTTALVAGEAGIGKTRLVSELAGREAQVLALVARGYTNREIAAELVISVRSAGVHVAHICVSSARRTGSRRPRSRIASRRRGSRKPEFGHPQAAAWRPVAIDLSG